MTAMQSGAGEASWSVGNVVSTAAAILFSHFVPFFGTALVASLPSLVFDYLVPDSYFHSIIDLIVGQIVSVTLVYGSMQALRGRQVTIGECLSEGLKRLGAALGVAILSGIGIFFGMILLIVPGLILAAMWAVAVPAAVIEEMSATAALSRSQELTRERRWRVFGAYFIAGLITVVGGAVVGGAVGVVAGIDSTVFLVAVWAFVALTQAFTACVVATLYYYLRRDKEGVEIHQIAAVFD
ncbi:MAG: glycerophosphoryl diester phosphodiesterase membrane domain-containing protein [Reyranellales bacterium]|jgi:hypothetical protein